MNYTETFHMHQNHVLLPDWRRCKNENLGSLICQSKYTAPVLITIEEDLKSCLAWSSQILSWRTFNLCSDWLPGFHEACYSKKTPRVLSYLLCLEFCYINSGSVCPSLLVWTQQCTIKYAGPKPYRSGAWSILKQLICCENRLCGSGCSSCIYIIIV